MLVLSRRIGETILIGEDAAIEVQLLEIRGRYAKIGISAPDHVKIFRQEVWVRIQQTRENAIKQVDS